MPQKYRLSIFIFLLSLASCQLESPLFEKLEADKTQIDFANTLTESEQLNILSYEYFYNGGGMAAGDFDNDGFTDLYFSGNQVANKLYLNKGNLNGSSLRFEEAKNTGTEGRKNAWKTGVALVDINNDGWLDIYQCYSGLGTNADRKNELYINQGAKGRQWLGKFSEEAEAYGIADVGYSTHATFFDYDLDGDLDLFVMNHNLKNYQRKEAAIMKTTTDELAGDRLYRNNSPKKLAPPSGAGGAVGRAFTDITAQAGIKSNALGFGLGVVVADFNQDNYPDLYVANDYVEEDYLYLNNRNGTFKEVGKEAIGHFSYSSMGVDAADINNDALPDLFTADMLPETNTRQKLLAFPDNWNVQQSMLQNGFHWQNMRNMLQINVMDAGHSTLDSGNKRETKIQRPTSNVHFQELGQLAGVSATDWSWSPLFADFDNDGFKDLFVSNGFVKDLTDLDFVKYYLEEETKAKQNQPSESLLAMVKKMPTTPTHHYIFRNNGNLTFDNKVKDWGFEHHTIGCGAIYADLDNDGDLEIITNNTNQTATIYNNQQQETLPKNYIKIRLKEANAKIFVYTKGKVQYYENSPTHGYQSSIVAPVHIGLGDAKVVDSVKIVSPQAKVVKLTNVAVNRTIDVEKITQKKYYEPQLVKEEQLFEETNALSFIHQENPFIDFNRQILLPRMYSRSGPKFAKGDVNGDRLEDLFITNAEQIYLQKPDNTFSLSNSYIKKLNPTTKNIDAVFIDIDNDRDLDLYIANGGYEQILEDKINEDELWVNDGKGNFTKTTGQIPSIVTNKCSVKTIDFDNDHDQDLFIAGSVRAGLYPYCDPSYLLRNDGRGRFSIVQKFDNLGLVMDVAITDIDNDRFVDVILAGEFMPITFLKNNKGKLEQIPNPKSQTQNLYSNSLSISDLDNDGDKDIVVGNLGLNTPLKASTDKPLLLYYGDADGNGTIEPYIFNHVGEKPYPIAGRDEALEQWIALRKKFTDYKSFSTASVEDLFDAETLPKMEKMSVEELKTGILWNNKGAFTWQALPTAAQTSPVYAIAVDDFNHDGIKDILLAGNESNFRIRIGKTDANYGLILLGKKDKTFMPLPQNKSGLYLKGDVRALVKIKNNYFVGINNGAVKSYKLGIK